MEKITEEDNLQVKWYEDAENVTVETLPAFIDDLVSNYEHDYGTIVHAVAAAGLAAMYAVDHSPQGGITGFQAGAVQWEMINEWGVFGKSKTGMRFINYDDLLYPQYERKFTTISKVIWARVQEEAKKVLADDSHMLAPRVKAHMESVAAGNLPFGLKIEEDDE